MGKKISNNKHVRKFWDKFEMRAMKDYHEL